MKSQDFERTLYHITTVCLSPVLMTYFHAFKKGDRHSERLITLERLMFSDTESGRERVCVLERERERDDMWNIRSHLLITLLVMQRTMLVRVQILSPVNMAANGFTYHIFTAV